jgi:ankyrin repeat protein
VVTAAAKAQVRESTLLLLLKRAIPDAQSTAAVEQEYGSVEEFLSTQQHADVQGCVVMSGQTVLHLACRRGFAEVAGYLLELGADPLVKDDHGATALSCSIACGHRAATRVLYGPCPDKMKRAVNILAYAVRKFLLRRPLRKLAVVV